MVVSVDRCDLLTDTFAKLIQLLLGFVAISTLWVKREMEIPKRNVEVSVGNAALSPNFRTVLTWTTRCGFWMSANKELG